MAPSKAGLPELTVRTFVRTFVESRANRGVLKRRYRFYFQELAFSASHGFALKFGC